MMFARRLTAGVMPDTKVHVQVSKRCLSHPRRYDMTARTVSTLLLIFSSVTTYANAQTTGRDSPAEATIRALDDQERLAALNQDFAALERLWSEHFIVNAPSNQILSNRSAVLDWFRKGMTTRSSYERSIEQIRVDGDMAIVMGAETLKPTGNAPQAGQTVRRRFTNIWKKEGDTWRLWARHANLIPAAAAPKGN
jgi:ketosteroid isomerase-like protein